MLQNFDVLIIGSGLAGQSLAERGDWAEAQRWLELARQAGNLTFLRVAHATLQQSSLPHLQAWAPAYAERIAALEAL